MQIGSSDQQGMCLSTIMVNLTHESHRHPNDLCVSNITNNMDTDRTLA